MSDTPGQTPPDRAAQPKGAGRLRGFLYVLLLIAGILLAWQIHRFYFQRPAGPATDKLARWINAQMPASAPAPGATNPAELARRPEAAADLVPLATPPAGLPPPPGAQTRGAWQRRAGAYVEEYARYRVSAADMAAAAEHYKTAGAKAGFTLAGDRVGPQQRTVVLTRSGWRVAVLISPGPWRGVTVTVAATKLPVQPPR